MNKSLSLTKGETESFKRKYEQCLKTKSVINEKFIVSIAQAQFSISQAESEQLAHKTFSLCNNPSQLDQTGFFMALRFIQCIQNGLSIDTVDIYNIVLTQKLEVRKSKSKAEEKKPLDVTEPQDFEKPMQQLDLLTTVFVNKSKYDPSQDAQDIVPIQDNIIPEPQMMKVQSLQNEIEPVVPDLTSYICEEKKQHDEPPIQEPVNETPTLPVADYPPKQIQADSDDDDFEMIDFSPRGPSSNPSLERTDAPLNSPYKCVRVKPFVYVKDGYISGFYQCKVHTTLNESESEIRVEEVDRRYSDFTMLQDYILSTYMSDGLIIPMLPEKESIVGNISKLVSTPNLEERRQGLEQYLNDLINQETIHIDEILHRFLTEKSKFEIILKELRQSQDGAKLPNPQDYHLQHKLTGFLFERELPFFSFLSKSNDINSKFYDQFRLTQGKYSNLKNKQKQVSSLMAQVNKFYITEQLDTLKYPKGDQTEVIDTEIISKSLLSINRCDKWFRKEKPYRAPIDRKLKEMDGILKKVFFNIDNLRDQIQLWNNKRQKLQKDPNFFSFEERDRIEKGEEDFCLVIDKLNKNLDIIIATYPQHISNLKTIFTTNLVKSMEEIANQ